MFRSILLLFVIVSNACSVPDREAERHKVVVVGAGVSGFAAAATLLEHNVTDLVILEASDRIGGRVHTVKFAGMDFDLGGEFVHGEKDNAVFEMVNAYDLLTSYNKLLQADHYLFANTTGHVFNSTYVYNLVEQGYHLLYSEGAQHFNGSIADYFSSRMNSLLTSSKVDPPLGQAIHRLVELLEGTDSVSDDLSQIGAWDFSQVKVSEGDLTLKWKTGGYKTIFDFLSKKFPNPAEELPVVNKTVFNKQVTRVDQRVGDVQVTCADGSTYLADHVIMTVSLGVLKKHAAAMFKPPLPADKTAAIQGMGFGCLGKVFLLFPTRWWPTDVNLIVPLFSNQELQDFQNSSKHGYWTSYTTGFHPILNNDRMLMVWLFGQACRTMETLTEDQVIDGLMELLNTVVGKKFNNIPRPESILRSKWASNPYTLGAYSFMCIDGSRHNITNDDLARPVLDTNQKPVILFAGEATAYFSGTVHGALSSGRREALNLIKYLNKQAQPNTASAVLNEL